MFSDVNRKGRIGGKKPHVKQGQKYSSFALDPHLSQRVHTEVLDSRKWYFASFPSFRRDPQPGTQNQAENPRSSGAEARDAAPSAAVKGKSTIIST